MATKNQMKVELQHERDTKGTRVFTSQDEDAPIPTLYIRKPAANDLPDSITVTIEAA